MYEPERTSVKSRTDSQVLLYCCSNRRNNVNTFSNTDVISSRINYCVFPA